MFKKIFALVFLLKISMGLQAQMSDLPFTEFDLENGLHVILHQDNSTPIVAVSVLYHVGSKNENPNRTGFAHFFEHLMFEGSENIDRGEFDTYVSNAGGVNNANTTQDRTFYYEIFPSNQLELGLWLESERMLHAKIDHKGIETQREVVKEEKRQRVDNQPYGTWLSNSFERAYHVHPYKWPVIGSMEDLNAASDEDFKNFYKKYYLPNNATLSIAGDIDIEQTKALIAKYFSDIPAGPEVTQPDIVEPPLEGPIVDTIYDNISLPAMFLTYRIPAQTDPDIYPIKMLATLLSGGESSRMVKKLKNEEKLAIQITNFPMNLEDPGVSFMIGLPNMGIELSALLEGVDQEIVKVQNELITDREYQKLQNQFESEFIQNNTSMVAIAESLANYYTYFGNTNLINTEIEKIKNVTKEDIRRVANDYFTPDNRVVLFYLPKQQNQ
ncbi:insulinase family protein [Membranicola marinus]|uniref:Insulinase family protein n=1 Tax=Membranihabitans marinus TaxID=1227546 RepID=A0A953L7L8_9BACT|nr:pitrilysin family protein [Membranihabitans marinus]MBY5958857.1 insulinase family protein [Membranihabitans marinus]